MHARVITVQARPESMQDLTNLLRDASPRIRDLPGFRDGVLLVDPSSHTIRTITLWEDEASLKESASVAAEYFGRAADFITGEPQRQQFEVLEHRPGSGRKFARVSTGRLTAEAARQSASQAGENPIIQAASQQPGYAGFLMLGDAASRAFMGMSFWDSKAHLDASERGYYTQQMGDSRDQYEGGQWTREVFEVAAEV